MLSLHENITPQILVFRHELPFFPSYFVWIPFCFCRGFVSAVDAFLFLPWNLFVFAVDLFLPWICFCCEFVFVVDSFCFCHGFVFAVDSFCFCCGFLCVYSFFLFVFLFSSLVPSIISHEIRKTWEFFGKKSIVFWKISIVFLFFSEMLRSYHAFKCACERKSMPSINPSA